MMTETEAAKDSTLIEHADRLETSGPLDVYICKYCKGRIYPLLFAYHLQSKHGIKMDEKTKQS
ncbi:MAG: hypothetical protein M1368_01780 [Thaumarchaeota archaeon]|nr:hypothetical protein [Nitrososphaerota archaeon]